LGFVAEIFSSTVLLNAVVGVKFLERWLWSFI